MPTKMVFVCSCGQVFDIGDSEGVTAHIDANPTHTATEGYAHTSATGVPRQLPVEAADGTVYRVTPSVSGGISSESDLGTATKMPKSKSNASTDPGVDDDASEGYEVGSRWLNTLTGDEFVCFDNSFGAAVWGSTTESGGGQGIWGSDAAFAESKPVSVRTATTPANKVVLNATASEAGTYRLAWSYGWSADTTSRDFEAQIIDGSSNQLMHHCQEPKDAGGQWEQTGTDQKHRASGFLYLDLSAGSHTFTLRWRSSFNGHEASIWDATLEFWRHD